MARAAATAAKLVRDYELLVGINQVRILDLRFIRAGDLAISYALTVQAMGNGPKRIAPLYRRDLDGLRLGSGSGFRRHRWGELSGCGHLRRWLALTLGARSDRQSGTMLSRYACLSFGVHSQKRQGIAAGVKRLLQLQNPLATLVRFGFSERLLAIFKQNRCTGLCFTGRDKQPGFICRNRIEAWRQNGQLWRLRHCWRRRQRNGLLRPIDVFVAKINRARA